MSFVRLFDRWRRKARRPAPAGGEDEIDEELMFHLRALVDDYLAKGMPADDAWSAAQRRFGSLRRYAVECQSVEPWRRRMWPAAGLAAVGVLTLLVAWLSVEVRALREQQAVLREAAGKNGDAPAVPRDALAGKVLDDEGNPIAGARLMVILKTWPDGQYRQQDFFASSDSDGGFNLPQLVPRGREHAVQVAVFKQGYALASTYQLKENGEQPAVDPIVFRLPKAEPVTLVVNDESGQPVANARVAPAGRKSADGVEHLVYFQASRPVQATVDGRGRLELDCFRRGDEAQLFVQVADQEWKQRTVHIPREGNTVELAAVETTEGGTTEGGTAAGGSDEAAAEPAAKAAPEASDDAKQQPPATGDAAETAIDPKLLGTWRVVEATTQGHADTQEHLESLDWQWTFGASEITTRWLKRSSQPPHRVKTLKGNWTYTVDPARSPAWIDQRHGENSPATPGIYRIEGDTLTICSCHDDKKAERPTAFESKADSTNGILVLKRMADAQAEPEPKSSAAGPGATDAERLLAAIVDDKQGRLVELAGQIVKHDGPTAIPLLIAVMDADNSHHTVYGLGHFALRELTGVEYSPFHDGAWWRRWWEANRQNYPEEVSTTPIPELAKTEHGGHYTPFPEQWETLEGKLAAAGAILKADLGDDATKDHGTGLVSNLATEAAQAREMRAIPCLIGLIEADNSIDTVYVVGYFGLGKLTGVEYSHFHDGAWWRRWWEKNRGKLADDVRAMEIPVYDRTPVGRVYQPFPADSDTLQGKLALAAEVLDGFRAQQAGKNALPRIHLIFYVQELAGHDDPHAIPYLIGMMEAEPQAAGIVQSHGLVRMNKLTGVDNSVARNADWWRTWWKEAKSIFPADVQTIEIPDYKSPLVFAWTEMTPEEKARAKAEKKRAEMQAALADVLDVPAEERQAEGDANKRYYLIGSPAAAGAPEAGRPLLVVLPGGDGGEEFHPFVRRIYKHVLDNAWLMAEPVASQWDAAQARENVWPTAGLPAASAKFTTEEFIAAIIFDVKTKARLDPHRVFLLGWSSGGPACYATLLAKDSQVAGAFIAMSVFHPDQLPALAGAKGKPLYLLQSPADLVTPIRFAEEAEAKLTAAGATVRLDRYAGGHGWHGDIFGTLRTGIEWLDAQASK
ncbi:MAG TPA: TIGR03067 domain-containing protein [Pirellulales bacterium]|jgi:uncharacterized protein (TIGR03067 family)|nr:TIGR03067 domain-containing protein [Pirellulales bacterium]